MPYLNLDIDFFGHPKTRRLVRLLGKGSEVVPIRLWAYVGKYHPEDGKLTEYSAQEIEDECQWWGESGKMVQALMEVGFLHQNGNGYEVHEWLEHEGHLKSFKERAKVAANARWSASGNAPSIPPSNAPTKPTKPSKPTKKRFGEYQHVKLKDSEYQKLVERFGEEGAKERIKALDDGIELKGYKYKSHYLAVLKWAEKDKDDDPFAAARKMIQEGR